MTAHDDDADLRAHLAVSDVPCPSCGYNLRGVPSARCPECAMPLDMEIVTEGTAGQQLDRSADPRSESATTGEPASRGEIAMFVVGIAVVVGFAIWVM